MESYAFTKKQSLRGNLEMRTMFGRNMAIVLTKVNDFYYINLYNNNPKNPGRCSLGWDEFLELTNMKEALEQLFPQFQEQKQPQAQTFTIAQQPQSSTTAQQPTPQELMPPPPPYTAQPIRVLGQCNKRPNTLPVGPISKKPKNEENFDPMDFFSQLQ